MEPAADPAPTPRPPMPRRHWPLLLLGPLATLLLSADRDRVRSAEPAVPRAIGSRLEPFVDDWLIERMKGVALTLHAPTPREVAVRFNTAPWEGIDTAYVTVFKDGDRYRMYYRGNP